tara:strand:- start:34829 stop:37441 length:2613 start_codon:yes stop_codon:yes gene_type:complete
MRTSFLTVFYGVVTLLLFVLVPCPVMGQELAQKNLTEADYSLWSKMSGEQLSDKGNWTSYRLSYENAIDTTFLVHTSTQQKIAFPTVLAGKFIKEESFAFQREDNLVLFNLQTHKEIVIPKVTHYGLSEDGTYLVTLENQNTLVVRKNGEIVNSIEAVSTYAFNYQNTSLVYASLDGSKSTIGLLRFDGALKPKILSTIEGKVEELFKWQVSANSFAFYAINDVEISLNYYDLRAKKLHVLKSSDSNFMSNMNILPSYNAALSVSRDGQKVFFGITPTLSKDTSIVKEDVEVWHSKDQYIYRSRKLKEEITHANYLAVWYPKKSLVRQLTNDSQSWIALNGSQDYALVADVKQYEPQYEWIAPMDYYLMSLTTGKKVFFLEAFSGYNMHLSFSPDGRYITYYKDGNWWSYTIATQKHVNLTKGLNVVWDNYVIDPGTELHLWGQAGWTKNDGFLLCYDYNDIWKIAPDGKQRIRLTKGKETQLQFRLHETAISNVQEFNYAKTPISVYDLTQDILLEAVDLVSGAKGYYSLSPNQEPKVFVMDESSITNLSKAKEKDAYIYIKQRFDQPPALFFKNGKSSKVVFQSNSQHYRYQWGTSEMIYFKDSKGNFIKGALFYPASYEKGKTYPLVVSIYENLSQQVYTYVNPTLHNGIGFNVSNFTTNGYAVLLPDIVFESGNPGKSATDCVTAAVNQVIAMGVADAAKIGLMGQSFGGYETNIIITQTDLFAAAISGCSIANIVESYFSFSLNGNTMEAWRYENQQLRMGFPFYDNQEAYYTNSPLHNASKITTPLLTWAGKLDSTVSPRQSETLYAALRRLKKEHVMLLYENEGHIFTDSKNQADLTHKMFDWFGHYLKDEPKAKWMKADVED